MNTSDLPLLSFTVIAVVCLLGAGLCSAGAAALRRITRNEAAEAFAGGQRGGQRIIKIVAKRPAAITGLSSLRALFTSFFGMFTALAIVGLVHSWWQAVLGFVLVCLLVMLSLAAFSPTALGVQRPVKVLGWLSGPILAITGFFAVFIRARETSPEETEQLHEDRSPLSRLGAVSLSTPR